MLSIRATYCSGVRAAMSCLAIRWMKLSGRWISWMASSQARPRESGLLGEAAMSFCSWAEA